MQLECGSNNPNALIVFGPTIKVRIGFDSEFLPTPYGNPIIPPEVYPALLDTGATLSCIDSELVTYLNLPIVDRQTMSGIQGPYQANMHLAQIFFPDFNITQYGVFAGVHLTAGNQIHRALIGRTFLTNFLMVYNGQSGSVKLSNIFRK